MIPIIIKLGPIPVHSFGLAMVLGFLAAWRLFAICLQEAGRDPALAERVTFWAAVGGIAGGRLIYLMSFPEEVAKDPLGAIFSSAGFVFYGGFLGGALASLILLYREKQPFLSFADLAAPALSIGYAIGRIGCQLSGDGDYGQQSSLPWAIGYPLGVVPTPPGVTVHPTPVYETLAALLLAWVLLKLLRAHYLSKAGQLFGLYLVLSSLNRFLVEIIRIEPAVFRGFTQAQLWAWVIAAIGIGLMLNPVANARHC